jgi:hypothetical protein
MERLVKLIALRPEAFSKDADYVPCVLRSLADALSEPAVADQSKSTYLDHVLLAG